MLKATNIHKSYGSLKVLKGVSLELEEGEVATLVGTSGAGKSTLLQLMGTLDRPDEGTVYFRGENVTTMPANLQAQFRNRNLGFVFQFHHLLPEFTALENVCMPAWISGADRGQAQSRGLSLLERLGLEKRAHHKPAQMSGGEQQRVAVARALINKPQLVLADEPTGNLDTTNSEELYQLLVELAKETHAAILIATHNMELAARSGNTYKIRDGLIE